MARMSGRLCRPQPGDVPGDREARAEAVTDAERRALATYVTWGELIDLLSVPLPMIADAARDAIDRKVVADVSTQPQGS
jgi:hypothetical protein